MHASSKLNYAFLFFLLLVTSGTLLAQNESFIMTPIGANNLLNKPWDLHYGPDGYLWVTEREAGVVVRINPATAQRDELLQIPEVFSSSSQDGLLGIALHEGILGDNPYVYLSYTYLLDGQRQQKIVRYTYTITGDDGALSSPTIILDNLPASYDHNSGRLIFTPDQKLFYSIGDQGNNQNSNYCDPILSQVLPTQEEIDQGDWANYPGKILRLNTDGSIPDDNPVIAGVKSHIYTYGHRNPQGMVLASSGQLFSDEHGPVTDDEVNIIYAGDNYGWPNVAGFQDDQAYDYCNWSSATDCESLDFSESCPPGVTLQEESSFSATNFREPLFSMFAVTDDYDYNNPDCQNAWICRPNVAPSSIGIYESEVIPEWANSLLVTSLKRGRVYRFKLDEAGTAIVGDTTQHFYTQNRYRDIVLDPDGKSFYVITDQGGNTSGPTGLTVTNILQNPGAILKFTYQDPVSVADQYPSPILRVWPNPASNIMYLDLKTENKSNLSAKLINPTGQVIREFETLQTGINELNINDLPAGVFTLMLSSGAQSWSQRVVVY
ncbi:MAG: glucose/sorbosone family PQQ-dependent dehydrogenase [Lewinella sp.]|jgi:PQQ-dependent dehydrogenase (s-GDH family)|uniref:glucose/sorbosone family PQQ-dependent dehydrogenase n=1 Tax=Lewinella sp. TaxID=2004506 RepID=UPI003D6A8B7A